MWAPRREALAALVLLALGLSGTVVISHSASPARGTRIVRVGQGPAAVAVASRAGRAFVANYGDATVSVLDAHSGALLRTVRYRNAHPDAGPARYHGDNALAPAVRSTMSGTAKGAAILGVRKTRASLLCAKTAG